MAKGKDADTKRQRGRYWTRKEPLKGALLQANLHAGEGAFISAANVCVGGIELEEFIGLFREEGFESSLSECLSIAICLSPRFRSFYGKVVGTQDLDKRLHEVCSFIGGVPHQPSYPGLANLIFGAAVDADKIDYLNRDAQQCGIPVGVDVSRVFLNSALVRIDERQALALSRSRGPQSERRRFSSGTHFIVNSSGIDTYDELANAKLVLYQRVYLHQLTRNAEQVLAEALRAAMQGNAAAGSPEPNDVFSWFEFGDDEFLARLSSDVASKKVAMRLITRDLPKRAFAIFRDACEPFITLHDIFDPREWGGRDGSSALSDLDLIYHRRTCWRLFDQLVPFDPAERPRKLSELRTSIQQEAIESKRGESWITPSTPGLCAATSHTLGYLRASNSSLSTRCSSARKTPSATADNGQSRRNSQTRTTSDVGSTIFMRI